MSLLGLFSLFPLLPISAQDIADQHPLPDSIGSKMKYNATIEMKKGYLSGICMLIRDKDGCSRLYLPAGHRKGETGKCHPVA